MSKWWRQIVGGLPVTFWYLWTASLINRTGAVGQLYLGVYLLSVRHFDAAYAGLVIGLGGAGTALGALPGGILADRWGRRPTMLAAGLPAAITMLFLGHATGRASILILSTLLGVFLGAVRPAFTASIIDVVAVADRGRALNLNYWAFNLGSGAAALLAGLLVRVEPALLFALNAGVLLFSTLLLAWKVPETRPAPATTATTPAGPGTVARDRVFLTFVGLAMLGWTMIETNKILPVALTADGLDVTSYGQVIVVNMALIVIGQLFLLRLTEHRRREHVLAVSAMAAGLGFGLVPLADTLWAYALTVAVWTIGEMLMTVANSALTVELAPPEARGRYQGVFSFGLTAAMFVGPSLGGLVADRFGPDTLWVAVLGLGMLLTAAHLAAGPPQNRRLAQLRLVSEHAAPHRSSCRDEPGTAA
ncbi:MFS transporter [Actinoplanes xinjiangensis]|uniref:Putative MFS family arabinose efflux permease n=1 Tax=Actinoplanes xinjiangensis TaxID=512350 RepID=A0A316EX28_9ACTN|nr:MFS transporter [Actinoplanes xinjiangensis]PWK27744.1 putative MFS family arabinose efflux permease [Actinoplanes xinjiangensis]GIF45171.1 MFS transporter [Actinoplanes xinjiangensis]